METSVEECLEALRDAADHLGDSPTKAEYEDLGLTPASATIIRVVGGWNEAKRRAGLETNHSRGTRVSPEPEDLDLPADTGWGDLSVDQRWHYRNRNWNTRRSLERRQRKRAWLHQLKAARGCQRCDETDPACLVFHHRDGVEKEMAVGKMVTYGYAKDEIRAEIDKCEVLCANCHQKEHYETPDPLCDVVTD